MHKLIICFFLTVSLISVKASATVEPIGKTLLAPNDLNDTLPANYATLGLKEIGKAQFSVLFWDIYNSFLYTTSGKYTHDNSPTNFVFKIKYLRDITTEDLIERTIEQWQHLEVPKTQYEHFIPKLTLIWPDISAGDALTMLVQNGQSVFYFNNTKVGIINDPTFSKLFVDIWLSPKTSQPILRAQLLGEIANDESI